MGGGRTARITSNRQGRQGKTRQRQIGTADERRWTPMIFISVDPRSSAVPYLLWALPVVFVVPSRFNSSRF